MTQTPSFRRSRDLDKSNTFRQMQELTNDYSVIKLHNIFHIAYKAIEFSTNKKEPTITFRIPILERQRGSHWSWRCNGGFVHKANRTETLKNMPSVPIVRIKTTCFYLFYNWHFLNQMFLTFLLESLSKNLDFPVHFVHFHFSLCRQFIWIFWIYYANLLIVYSVR